MEQQLADFKADGDSEHLHLLRVAIKKVKAILALLEVNYDVNYDTKRLQNLFNKACKIRELQLSVLLLKKLNCQPETVIIELELEQEALQEKLVKRIPGYIKGVKKFRKETDFSFPLPAFKKIEKYLSKKKGKVGRNFDAHTRSGMHSFRMKIKNLLFVYSMLPNKIKPRLDFPVDRLHELVDEVGAWHDTWAAIQFLQQKKIDRQLNCMEVLYQLEANQFCILLSKWRNPPSS